VECIDLWNFPVYTSLHVSAQTGHHQASNKNITDLPHFYIFVCAKLGEDLRAGTCDGFFMF